MKPNLLFAMILVWITGIMAQDPQTLIAPPMIDFQGRLADPEGNPVNASLDITFSLYESAAGGTAFWSETQTVQVAEGLFQVTLGSVVQLTADLFQDADRWLGIQVGTEAEMSPRTKFSSVGFALQAEQVNLVTNASLSGTGTSLWPLQIAQQGASAGQVLKWDGASWSPGEDSQGTALWQQDGNDIYFNSGDVGIGTINPRSNFEIASSAIPQIRLNNTSTEASNVQKITFWKGSTEKFAIGYDLWGDGDDLFTLYDTPNLVPVLNIQNSNVGIGAFPENSKVHIKVNSNVDFPQLLLEENGGDYARLTFKNTSFPTKYWTWAGLTSDNDGDSRMNLWYHNGTSGKDLISIRGNGNFGLGVFNPYYPLCVNSGLESTYMQFSNNGSGSGANDGLYIGLDGSTGWIYNAESGPIRLATIFGTVMFINTNGRVGIGTTSPDAALHVEDRIRVGEDPNYGAVYGELIHEGGGTGFRINANASGGWADLHFQTDGNTRMFIESAGRVGIGTTSPTQSLDVNGTVRIRGTTSGTVYTGVYADSNGNLILSSSDARLKENILRLENSLEKVMQLKGVSFSWKEEPGKGRHFGFIAQEFEQVVPELVFTNQNDGYKGINYEEMTALLVEAMKELNEKVDHLQTENQALKALNESYSGDNEQLNARLERLERALESLSEK